MVVSNVQIRPSFRRMWPKPRATSVSNCIQLSIIPSVSEASSPSAIFQFDGFVSASRALSMSRTCSLPSIVLMFQVKVTRSRQ